MEDINDTLKRIASQKRPGNRLPPATPGAPAAPGTLYRCRCRDCQALTVTDGWIACDYHIGGTKIIWGTGEQITEPDPNQWIYCTKYQPRRTT